MKTIAMYLPQFHRVKENDEWWGEGFTEWTAVKNAQSLYDGHIQPIHPLNDNYYDLMDKQTMKWQADLARKYNIDGFAFYHYYFKDGRKILEKPAENLLKWKDIDMPFFFAWAAEQWARSWTNVGNAWAGTFEDKEDKKNGVLLEQDCGGEQEWEEHFQYMLPFFRDERYIKVDGKPVIYCYHSDDIKCLMRMMFYWRTKAIEEGFSGIYLIAHRDYSEVADAYINPMNPRAEDIICDDRHNNLRVCDYGKAWKDYLTCINLGEAENLYQCMVKFDDSPRHGSRGTIFEGATPEKFKKYFAALRYKSLLNNSKFLFINAWNEWGEGMYLEPDTRDGYAYLEAVRDVTKLSEDELQDFVKASGLIDHVNKGLRYQEGFLAERKEKKKYALMRDWLKAKLHDEAIKKYLQKHSYKKVAIYGFGVYGHMLYQELIADGINVPFAVDRKLCASHQRETIPILGVDKQLPPCDLIIISTVSDNVEIYEQLLKITTDEVISMEELLKYVIEDMQGE